MSSLKAVRNLQNVFGGGPWCGDVWLPVTKEAATLCIWWRGVERWLASREAMLPKGSNGQGGQGNLRLMIGSSFHCV